MPKKYVGFRLSESAIATLKKYQQEGSLTDALETALERLQYLETHALETQTPKETPECKRRLKYLGKDYCVQTSPIKGLNRLKEIVTLEICKICKLERWKIPESTEIKQHQEIATEVRDPKREGYKQAGMIFCDNVGLWVFPSKCSTCKFKCQNYLNRQST